MPRLLKVDAGSRSASISRRLTERLAQRWTATVPGAEVIHRDLSAEPIPHVSPALADHFMYRPGCCESDKPEDVLVSERLLAELKSADALLLGVPMHNFGVPSSLKAWIDHVVWPGHTFSPESGGLLSLPAVVVCSRGGGYGPGSPKEAWNFQEPYLRYVLSFVGITDVEFVNVEFTMFTGEGSPRPDLGTLGEETMRNALARIDSYPYEALIGTGGSALAR